MQLELLGRRAAELLFDAISGDVQPGIHPVSTKLVTRGSTALA
jgi:LacI family transcriptional regulator